MIRAIAIDDEWLALERIKELLEKEKRVELKGTFTDSQLALKYLEENKVDLIFMDVELWGVSGMEIAERVRQISPSTDIVFVTAHDQYALKALKLKAVDYLIKPVMQKDIEHIIAQKLDSMDKPAEHKKLTVKCFGQFSSYIGKNKNESITWRTAKSEELFALLIYYEGKFVSKDVIIEELWPSTDYQKALNYLHVTSTYLRNSFESKGIDDIVVSIKKCYKINMDYLDCDIITFKTAIEELDKEDADIKLLEKASALYVAPYLRYCYYGWAMKVSQEYEEYFQKLQCRLKKEYLKQGDLDKAIRALYRILEFNPIDEYAIEQLIELKIRAGNTVSASMLYSKYKAELKREMNLIPSKKMQLMIESIHFETGVGI